MNNFQKITHIVCILYLLLMSASTGYSDEVTKTVQYRADFGLYAGINKEYSIPKDFPVYLFFKFVLSPGYMAADLTGKVTFDQENQTITITGTGGEFLTSGGLILNGNIVLDFEISPLGLAISETLLIPKFPQINKGWDNSVKFNSLLLNGKTAELEAGIRKLVSVQLSAIDIAKLILDAATQGGTRVVPQAAINAIKEWVDGGLQLNGGLTSDLILSGEAISVNGSRIVRESQSISAPGLDLSQTSYEVTSEYLEDFTYNLNFVVSSDFYVQLDPPLLGPIWSKEFEIVAVPIEILSEREGNLDFSTAPDPIVFPIQGTPTNQAPQTAGTIAAHSLTAGGSTTTVDASSYFSDPDNDNLTYSALSNNRSVATVVVSGSQVTITPSGQGSAEIIVRATDPDGSTATQRFTVTVQAAYSCTYTLSQSSQSVSTAGESISVNVTTGTSCAWSAWSNSLFLSVSPSSGTGSGTVTVTADGNTTTSSRTSNVTIAGNTFTVNQSSSSAAVAQTDLAIQSFQASQTTVTPGESFTLQITVNNNGPGSAQNIGISYYHSSIQGLSSEDRPQWQGTVWVDSLTSGASVTKSIALNAPSTAGTYYYGAWLAGVSDDTNINNNVATEVGVTVSRSTPDPPPDPTSSLGVCDRTPQVRDALVNIVRRIDTDVEDCSDVSRSHLYPITGLSLESDGITALQVGDFGDLDNLQTLYLYDNNLKTLPTGVFEGLSKLTSLKLRRNPLTTIESGAFNGLSSLAELDLSSVYTQTRGDLTTIESGAFKGLTNLRTLDLYYNKINTLPVGVFEGLNNVTVLYLRRNPLKTIKTGAFNGLSSLTKLDLSSVYTQTRGDLTTIETGAFNGLTSLTELNLYYNKINTLPTDVFKGLNNVTALYLRRNPLKTIKTGAFNGLSSLTKLDLSSVYTQTRGDLTTIESGAFKGLTNLRTLDLYYNKIAILPTDVFKGLNNVTVLYLRRNPLKTIKTGAFNGLSSLTKLDLSSVYTQTRGDLTTIETGAFNGLTSLTELNLYYNKINTLPTDVFKGLDKVTTLNLRRNPLKTIKTGAFNGLSSLTKLDLSSFYTQTRGDLTTIEAGAFKELTSLETLSLHYNKIAILRTGVFEGLNKVTTLHLRRNPLKTIEAGAFNGLSSLTKLDLSSFYTQTRGDLTTIESGAFKGLTNLRTLDLYYNKINTLPVGVFEGLNSLTALDLNRNPGTPFTLILELVRTDTTDPVAPGPATVVVQLAQGAPFEMTLDLSIEGGTLSATTATIERGKIQSDPITMTPNGRAPATLSLGAAPSVPSNYYGIRMAVGNSLSTGSTPPHALVKISGDNQQGLSGVPLENPFVVEVQDAANRGLKRVDVTFATIAGGGTLNETTVTTGANGQAESWLTLGSQPGTNTVEVSVEGVSQTVTFNALAKSLIFDLSVPSGTSLIHVPLKVTVVDGVAHTIESIADLYDALGGAATVNFLITYDPNTQGWLSYFGVSDTGTFADKRLTDDIGIIAGMKAPVLVRLRGDALGTNGSGTLTLNQGLNLVGLPLRDPRIDRVSDLLALEGIRGNVPVVILTDNGEFKVVGQPGDPSDIPITGGQSFILTAQRTVTVGISGDGWTNVSGGVAAPLVRGATGIQVTDTTPVLALRGSIVGEMMSTNRAGFRVILKNLSAPQDSTIGSAVAGVTGDEGNGYQLTVVDIATGRAAMIGDVLEISAQSPDPLIGVQPLRYTVTVEDVKRSLIQLPELVAYEIPSETQLLRNYPNPFNPETWIPYRLAEDAFVTLTIYDLSGQVVRTLDIGHQIASAYEDRSKAIHWDGRNEFGERVASDIYFYQLQADNVSFLRKMVILK